MAAGSSYCVDDGLVTVLGLLKAPVVYCTVVQCRLSTVVVSISSTHCPLICWPGKETVCGHEFMCSPFCSLYFVLTPDWLDLDCSNCQCWHSVQRRSCAVAVVVGSVWPMVLGLVLGLVCARLDAAYLSPAHRNSFPPSKTMATVLVVDVDSAANCEPSNSSDCRTYDVESPMSLALNRMNLAIVRHSFGYRPFEVRSNNRAMGAIGI